MKHSVHLGDCLEVMKSITAGSIDMILCDLPYGTTQNKWDSVIPFALLWEQYERVIKDNGAIVLTAAQPFTSALIMSNTKLYKYNWVWVKTQASGHLNAWRQPMRSTEDIIVFYKKQCLYKPILVDKPVKNIRPVCRQSGTKSENYGSYKVGVGFDRKCPRDKSMPDTLLKFANDQNGMHPTQKPVALFEYLIKTYTNEGDTVLDNCAGSGTTGVACENTGRNSILIEKEQKYYDIILNRLYPDLF